jgi:hypothetical protein
MLGIKDDFADLLFPQFNVSVPEMTDIRYWRVFIEFHGLRDQCADS